MSADERKITVDDLLSQPSPGTRAAEKINAHFDAMMRAANLKAEEECRAHVAYAAEFFCHVRRRRRWFDPRRLRDRFAERTCRQWNARSVAAARAMPTDPFQGGKVIYDVDKP